MSTIQELRDALIALSKRMPAVKYIWVGKDAAEAFGLPSAGAYQLIKGSYVLVEDWS